jgi:hypothetical protein
MQICVFALQLWKTDAAKLPFTHLIKQYMERTKNGPSGPDFKKKWLYFELMVYDKYRGKIPVHNVLSFVCWSQWMHGLRRRSKAAYQLGSWVRILPLARMFVCCVYCVLSGRGLCDELITHPEESYRLWHVIVCDQETLWMRRP